MSAVLRFVFGLAVGSFVNVLALRYHPDRFLVARSTLTGRSHCPHCGRGLRWYELIPLLSFVVQWGKCRTCRAKVSVRYPLVELASGLIFVLVPFRLDALLPFDSAPVLLPTVWVSAFITLLLVTLIDLRWRIIPNEAVVLLVVLGVLGAIAGWRTLAGGTLPFVGTYAPLFGFHHTSLLVNRLVGAATAALFFFFLVLVTRGHGMGMGDVKLVAALGVLFGWPATWLVVVASFIIGSAVYGPLIAARRASLKNLVPFGPFLAAGAVVTFFVGDAIVGWYFGLF